MSELGVQPTTTALYVLLSVLTWIAANAYLLLKNMQKLRLIRSLFFRTVISLTTERHLPLSELLLADDQSKATLTKNRCVATSLDYVAGKHASEDTRRNVQKLSPELFPGEVLLRGGIVLLITIVLSLSLAFAVCHLPGVMEVVQARPLAAVMVSAFMPMMIFSLVATIMSVVYFAELARQAVLKVANENLVWQSVSDEVTTSNGIRLRPVIPGSKDPEYQTLMRSK